MIVKISEVAAVLILVICLMAAKHVPQIAHLPLSQATGIVCFSFAIFISLKLFQFELARLRSE